MDSPAWRAMSHGARSLFLVLRRRLNSTAGNNGHIYLPQNRASEELRSSKEQVVRWFRELQQYGFIVMTQGGCLGSDGKGKAPHWRLTDCGSKQGKATFDLPTRDFLRWDGTRYKPLVEPPQKQNPGAENRSDAVRKTEPPPVRKTEPQKAASGAENRAIYERSEEHTSELQSLM